MSFSLLPTVITDELTDLTPEFLTSRGIQLLMMDFDNTIVPYTTNTPTPQMEKWLREMASSHIQLCVVSNSKRDRVKIFCKKYGIDCITHAHKPISPFPRVSGSAWKNISFLGRRRLWWVIRFSPIPWAEMDAVLPPS